MLNNDLARILSVAGPLPQKTVNHMLFALHDHQGRRFLDVLENSINIFSNILSSVTLTFSDILGAKILNTSERLEGGILREPAVPLPSFFNLVIFIICYCRLLLLYLTSLSFCTRSITIIANKFYSIV